MSQKLEVYNNNTPLNITTVDLEEAEKLLTQIEQSLSFFRVRLKDRPTMIDVHTHMGLFEHYLTDLTKLVKYDSVLQEEKEKRYAEIREKNLEIYQLHQKLGKDISPEGISAKLRDYDNVVRLWYGALGFHYASLKQYTPYGILYDFTHQLQYDQDDGCSSRKEWTDYFQKKFHLITEDNTTYDMYHDTYHAELLDTDKNRKAIQALLTENFPEYQIHEFRSRRNDFGSFSLEFHVNISYTDIENMMQRIVPKDKR